MKTAAELPGPIPLHQRAAGVLLHPTSLPGPFGVGDLGPEARAFAAFLGDAGLKWWQTLPLGPAGGGDSPYTAASAFAGNPLLLSLEDLAEDGLLDPQYLSAPKHLTVSGTVPDTVSGTVPDTLSGTRVRYRAAWDFKRPRLRRAFEAFEARASAEQREAFEVFKKAEGHWLEDYALFVVLKQRFPGKTWARWPHALRLREPGALARVRRGQARELEFQCFQQFLFQRQWMRLRGEAHRRGVGFFGDAPIFVAYHSADVWARQGLFQLDGEGRPGVVAGVPPDYFSETGQLWRNPHYRWEAHREEGYAWWIGRLARASQLFDAVRLDHFIGFQRAWQVPAGARDARKGEFAPGPGIEFFEAVRHALPRQQLVAEDLGIVTPEVEALRDRFGFPGMRVLQFAFGSDDLSNPHILPNHVARSVVYTGTHDNDTTGGWLKGLAPHELERLKKALGHRPVSVWGVIELAFSSTGETAIVPFQDLLGLGTESRLNKPGRAKRNWRWRMPDGAFTPELATKVRALAAQSGRL